MKDLLVSVRGGGSKAGMAVLEFDGQSYPKSPAATVDDLIFPDSPTLPPTKKTKKHPTLAQLTLADLSETKTLSEKRKEVIGIALKLGRDNPTNHYIFGSANPENGGFDCSGSMFYLLKKAGIQPPRTSAAQFDWIKKNTHITTIPDDVTSLDNAVFDKLRPGDLLFWSHTYEAADGRTNGITHVQMYLGKEKKDAHAVMIGSSDGRSYRGKHQNGYGVFDFRLPHHGSTQKFVGYGPPPGLDEKK